MKLETARGTRVEARARARARGLRRAVAAAVAIGAAFAGGALALGGADALARGGARWLAAGRDYARARLANARSESLRIDLKFKHLHRLHEKRDAALAAGILVPSDDDFVPASVSLGELSIPIELRLLGPEPAHFEEEPWSLEVRVGEDAHVQGMRHFAVVAPRAAGGVRPLVAAAHFERLGLAAPRTSLVELALNGDELGPALLVELPSDELLRARGRRAAPIVGLDAGPYWAAIAANGRAGPFDNPHAARAVALSVPRDAGEDADTAIGLLRAFLDGRLDASRVFALDETARWLAAAEVWGDASALHWSRARFALDAFSARLAPVPALPTHPPAAPRAPLVAARSALGTALLRDPELRFRFARALAEIAGELDANDPALAARLERRQAWALARVHRDDPFVEAVAIDAIAARANALRRVVAERAAWFEPSLASGAFAFPRVVAADAGSDGDGPYLDLANLLPIPVSVTTLRHDEGGLPGTPVTLASRTSFPVALPPTRVGATPSPVRIRYRQPNAAVVSDAVRGVALVAGDPDEHAFLARPSPRRLDAPPVPTATLDEALAQHPFLHREPGELALHARGGTFEVRGSLVLPSGVALVVEAGTELVFEPGAALVADAALDLGGTADAPVVLRGVDGRRDGRWEGVVLLHAQKPSRWSHVEIRGAAGVERPGWRVPAAVAVRNAAVEMERVRVVHSDAPTAVLVESGRLDARGLSVATSAGTAVELRASTALLTDVDVRASRGGGVAAIDARVRLAGGRIANVRGTALAAADASRVEASGLEIDTVGVAAAARNGGRLAIADSHVRGAAHAAFLAYTDRPELGGGELVADRTTVEPEASAAGPSTIAERGSRAVVDGVEAPTVDARIGDLRID